MQFFTHEDAFENVVCEMVVILSGGTELLLTSAMITNYHTDVSCSNDTYICSFVDFYKYKRERKVKTTSWCPAIDTAIEIQTTHIFKER